MKPLNVLPTLPLILKVNETFALFSAMGQIEGNRTVLTDKADTQTQHPFHGAEGIYLQENQGWEKAFITSWKKHKHGNLIGLNNGFVRFWDTRFFEDKRKSKK